MGGILFSMIFVTAMVGFIYYCNRKLVIVAALQPEVRWNNVGDRIKNVISKGFFQSRMIQGDLKAGIMHTMIFWGFMILLFRKLQLFTIAYSEFFVYPGLLGGLYATLKDLTEVGVMVGVGYAFYRRFVIRPKRLEPNREAVVILSLIMTIMVTDFFYDACKFALFAETNAAIGHEAKFAIIGGVLAKMVGGMSPALLDLGYNGFYWAQIITVLGFLVLLPLGEHFHIVTALPTLFLSNKSPLNKVPKVDLEALMNDDSEDEDGSEPVVGINTAKDLIWKDGLDVFTCTECGRCKESCPTFLTDKPLSLKWVNDSIKHHLMDKSAILRKDKIEEGELPSLVGEVISEDTLWACTTCGFCESACPIELEHLSKFYKMRQHRVMMEGEVPEELQSAFDNYERQSNPWGLNSAKRGEWADGLEVPLVESAEQVAELDYVFYTGSAQAFDSRNQKVAKAFVNIMNAAGVKFAILGAEEGSTGECVRRAGNEMLFQELATTLVETLNGYNVKNIVTCDPHAYNSLKNEYPDFEGHYTLIHHTELIEQLLDQGRIKVSDSFEKVIYHEPCYLSRHNGIYDAPRNVLNRITSDQPLEFAMNREKAMCCGAGGGRMWMEETIGTRINVTRVAQALDSKPKVIATACPYCTVMMTDGVAHHGKEEEIQVKDIAELVSEALVLAV